MRWLARRYMVAGYRLFDQAIKEAVEAGMIRSLPIMNVTNIIVSACTMTSSLSVLMDEVYEVDITREEYLSSFSDSLVEVLFKGLEAKRPELEDRRR
jgi:TetR/AcrR family transcriptional regulator